MPPEILIQILDTAASFVSVTEREVKNVPTSRKESVQVHLQELDGIDEVLVQAGE